MMKANDEDVQISASTSRIPAPQRRNMLADEGGEEMMDSVCSGSLAHLAGQATLGLAWATLLLAASMTMHFTPF